jgi:hypothetical protein
VRIVLFSDLHADVIGERRSFVLGALADALDALAPDVICFAGDAQSRPADLDEVLAPLARGRLANLYVWGNHEIWRRPSDIGRGRDSFGAISLLRAAATDAGWHFLPGAPVVIEGWGFAGTGAWYDYSFRRPDLVASINRYRSLEFGGVVWQDRDFARWILRDGRRLADEEVNAHLLAELASDLDALGLDEAGSGPPSVVITHHIGFSELVEFRGTPSYDFFSAYMGSVSLGHLIDDRPQIRAAFAGHTHTPRGFVRPDGFIAAINPIGYYGTPEFPDDMATRLGVFETVGDTLVSLAASRHDSAFGEIEP